PATVRCIFNAENLGFAGANNVGLRAAQDSEYVVLLNDDVIVTPGWLGALLRYLDDPQIGLVGTVTNAAGNEARVPVDYSATDGIDAFARAYTQAHDGVSFDIQALAMYCLALRQRTVAALGELDERFRVGMFEDDDYAMRARAAGYRVVCAEDVFVHHFGRSSFGKLSEEAHAQLFAANRAVFERKWGVTWQPHKYREG
ncbi:MAG TPA: glycosyltransferase, partial [Ktedonobacterales bacterium]|nr:glycosyltransferase [Ktedonobacterales bacterium]